jgi:hypothetical protein
MTLGARVLLSTTDESGFPGRLLMRMIVLSLVVGLAACGPRQVEVRTAPPLPAQNVLEVTNNAGQSVNVYVNYNGTDQFIQQVRTGTSLRLPVAGIPAGSTVTVWAKTVDGTKTWTKQNVVLNGVFLFPIP